jgi:methyl-accepting chemotaxis protein
MTTRKRRSYVNLTLNADLQFRMVAYGLIYMMVAILLTAVGTLAPLIYNMFFGIGLKVQYEAAQAFLAVTRGLMPALLCLLILYAVHLLFVTHRIVGPLMNFTQTFLKLGAGDFTRKVRLRRHDYLQKESEQINTMIDRLTDFLARLRSDHRQLVAVLEDLITKARDLDTQEKVRSALDILKREAVDMEESLAAFRISSDDVEDKTNDGQRGVRT